MDSNSESLSAWDLQNFGGKEIGILKQLKPSYHEVEDGFCGHGLGHNSFSRNLDLALPATLSKQLIDTYEGLNSFSEEKYSKEGNLIRVEKNKDSSSPIANLKLGTSADSGTLSCDTSSASVSMFPWLSSMPKRSKLSHQSKQTIRCQVEGCDLDLTSAKDYHRRHRICETHSKSPKVIVAGLERRFCQQCSRFHNLSEFDDKKRSCRRRLSDHNARRRRSHPEAIPFFSTGFSSSIYDGRPQNFLLNMIPSSASNTTWENFCSLKMAHSGNSLVSPSVHTDKKQHSPLPHLNSGKDASVSSSTAINEAPVYPRALSLLSTSSWGLNEPESPSPEQIMQGNISIAQPVVHLEAQNWPIISSEHVSKEQAASKSPVHSMDFHSTTDSSQFQDLLSFKTPYEPSFYYSSRIN